jgi:hypothetical protein
VSPRPSTITRFPGFSSSFYNPYAIFFLTYANDPIGRFNMGWRQTWEGWTSEWETRRRSIQRRDGPGSLTILKKLLHAARHSLKFLGAFLGLTGTAVLFLALWHVGEQAFRHTIIVEPFEVSKPLEAVGYTARVAANLLVDEIRTIQMEAGTMQPAEGKITLSWSQVDFDVPEAKISLRSLIELIKERFGLPLTRITGDVISRRIFMFMARSKNQKMYSSGFWMFGPKMSILGPTIC